jgi:hypothetical protein
MAPDDPTPDRARDAFRALEQRLDRASEAAERLIAEAAAESAAAAKRASASRASAAPKPPPAGWQTPGESGRTARNGDLELLVRVIESLRDLIPADLQRRLGEALRELLMAVRALIDWYLERTDQRRAEQVVVEDIPIH